MASAEGRVWGGMTAAQRGLRRREQLLDAGLDLFATRGWEKVTVLEICRAAKLSQRYFYEEFDGREALFLALVDRIADEFERVVHAALDDVRGSSPAERADHVLTAVVEHLTDDERRVKVALVESFATEELRERRARLLAQFAALASRLMAALGDADQRSRELSALVISGGFAEALMRSARGEVSWSREELVTHLTRLYSAAASL
jgi:AcrR family transcriptional regulator